MTLSCYRCSRWPCECADGITLIHGDCCLVDADDICPPDCLITDPPYGIENRFGINTGNGTRRLEFDWDHPDITATVIRALTLWLPRVRPKASAWCFCGGDQFGGIMATVKAHGFVVKPAVWLKQCPPPPGKGNWWPSGFELAVYGYRSSAWFGDEDPKRCNVFTFDSYRHGQPDKVDHPTQKPLRLMKLLVASLCPPAGLILELFAGSGSTLVAAKQLERRAIGFEIEEKYCEIAANRLRQSVLQFTD